MSKRSEQVLAAAQAMVEKRLAYETAMDARIASESLVIQSEWSAEEEWSKRVQKCSSVQDAIQSRFRSMGTEQKVREGYEE